MSFSVSVLQTSPIPLCTAKNVKDCFYFDTRLFRWCKRTYCQERDSGWLPPLKIIFYVKPIRENLYRAWKWVRKIKAETNIYSCILYCFLRFIFMTTNWNFNRLLFYFSLGSIFCSYCDISNDVFQTMCCWTLCRFRMLI